MTTIESFQATLIDRLLVDEIPSDLVKEADLERRFILPLVHNVCQGFRGLHVYAKPWKQRTTCVPDCKDGSGLVTDPELHGCRDCWEASKSWAAARLYGLHCFDLVVGDRDDSLALEVKLLHRARKGNRKANEGFQRLVGQCTLARLVHPRVVGFCAAAEGALDMIATSHLDELRRQGIHVIVRLLKGRSDQGAG
jgi:hypothetical protein